MRLGIGGIVLVNLLACAALVLAGCGWDTSGANAVISRPPSPSGAVSEREHPSGARGHHERDIRAQRPEDRAHLGHRSTRVHGCAGQGPVRHRDERAHAIALVSVEKDLDLQIIASLQRQSRQRANAVRITKDPSIENPSAQLKGKTIAVPSLTRIIVHVLEYLLGQVATVWNKATSNSFRHPFPPHGPSSCKRAMSMLLSRLSRSIPPLRPAAFESTTTSLWRRCRMPAALIVDITITSVSPASGRVRCEEHPET